MIEISSVSISPVESARHVMLMDSVRDIERIGDHFENIVELIDFRDVNRVKLTGECDGRVDRNVHIDD